MAELPNIKDYLKKRRQRMLWYRMLGCMAAVVAVVTVYALILPGVALENTADGAAESLTCGLTEHTHSDACYSTVQESGSEEGHVHTDGCYALEQGELTCQLEESEGHTHGEGCYDEDGNLVCQLEEAEGHTHGEGCYEQEKVLVCGLEEQTGESETGVQKDMDEQRELICGLEEHTHDESCKAVQADTEVQADAVPSDAKPAETDIEVYAASGEPQSIFTYTAGKDGATATITVADKDNHIIQPVDGIYHVTAGQDYYVNLAVASNEGMDPGLYYCTFPEGQTLRAEEGRLMLRDNTDLNGELVDVGRWYIDHTTNRLMFDISEKITDFTNLTLNATVTVVFVASDEPLDFDGQINIKVNPSDEKQETEVSKWARRNVENADPNKIYWEVEIDGNKNSQIAGSEFTDEITSEGTHHYTESDMANGIAIEAYYYGDSSTSAKPIEEHKWTVTSEDPALHWTESGWSYTIPESVRCEWHRNETFSPGSDGWLYYLKYTSTIIDDGTNGYVRYENTIRFDGDEATGRAEAGVIGSEAKIVKSGEYHSSSNESVENDTITWTITATIPGVKDGHKYEYYWHLWDGMSLKQGSTDEGYNNDLNNAVVTAIVDGQTVTVPEISDATENDLFCWENNYSSESVEGNGIWSGRQITLYSRCNCTEENCPDWKDGECGHNENGFCRCWCRTDNVIFNFTYETKAKDLIQQYGGKNASLYNYVELDNQQKNSLGEWKNVRIDHDSDEVTIPGVFVKENTEQPGKENNQIAEFTITLNETKKNLGEKYENVRIEDKMSTTLIFLPDTLTITAENTDGESFTLSDTAYTVSYDSATHQADIVLTEPGPYKYTLTYNARISVPAGSAQVSYENKAEVEIFGKEYTSNVKPTLIQNIVATGENYSVQLLKTDEDNREIKLKGAVFGLFNQKGTEICKISTDEDGIAKVETDTVNGVLFYEHTLCYLQELKAPEGYVLDSTKHWFWFCNQGEHNCRICYGWENNFTENEGEVGHRISNADSGNLQTIQIANRKQQDYELPETGGFGTNGYTYGGLMLICGAICLGYRKIKQRKEK